MRAELRLSDGRAFSANGRRNGGEPGTVDLPRIERAVREILLAINENRDREGLAETPERVARAYREMFSGLNEDAGAHVEHLDPRGVAVMVEAEHSCLQIRGALKHESEMVTTAFRGSLVTDPSLRGEALALMRDR